jgi:hypothetical protein
MNNDDMLIKQLVGRYSANKLGVKTIITHYDEMAINEYDLRKLTEQKLAEHVAQRILEDGDLRDITVGPPSPEYIGKEFRIETYCFSRLGLMSLITNAFNAGMEATKDKNEDGTTKGN